MLEFEFLRVLGIFKLRTDVLLPPTEPVEDLSRLAAGGVPGAGRGFRKITSSTPPIAFPRPFELLTEDGSILGV